MQVNLTPGMLNRVEAVIRAYDPCLSCSTHAIGEMALRIQLLSPMGKCWMKSFAPEKERVKIRSTAMTQVLIVGYGNPLRCDDGLGWSAAEALSRSLPVSGNGNCGLPSTHSGTG